MKKIARKKLGSPLIPQGGLDVHATIFNRLTLQNLEINKKTPDW